jgi:hypothetical protein
MPSLLPVLLHDRDLPEAIRTDLSIYESSPRDNRGWAARRRAAHALRTAFDLDDSEIAALLGVADPCLSRAA